MNETTNALPTEVSLVQEVKGCRKCKWFWGKQSPYGLELTYDWMTDYPPEIRNGLPQTSSKTAVKWMLAQATGYGAIEPAMLHGCRKAPIMTIGINPNLSSFFPTPDGGDWIYPSFASDARYAYAHRHQSIFQQSISPEEIRANLLPDGKVFARKAGYVVDIRRSSTRRWILLTLQYDGESLPETQELTWGEEDRYAILWRRSNGTNTSDRFLPGDVIAGRVGRLAGKAPLFAQGVGYNQRFLYVLNRLQQRLSGELADPELSIGEDVSQHDMVACASPGWSSNYDIPTDRIASNCVQESRFVERQLLQSRPAVIVLVGSAAVQMFQGVFKDEMKDLQWLDQGKPRDIYDLLRETTSRAHYLGIHRDGVSFNCRLVASPHFSYSENFETHARFVEKDWQAFRTLFATDAEVLDDQKLLQATAFDGPSTTVVRLKGDDDVIRHKLSVACWPVLMAHFYDPYTMLADALVQEYRSGALRFDSATKHLARTDGPCSFCVNSQWTFPEGCAYGKCGSSAT
jgi:uracil-DNA glycosylase